MKKKWILCTAMALAFGMLAGCAPKAPAEKPDDGEMIFSPPHGAYRVPAAAEKRPGIKNPDKKF